MLTARGWQEWVVHVSAYHLMGNLVQQMDFTVLCHWQLDLWAKELLFEKVPRREIRFLPWGVCSNCRNAILMTFLNSWRFWRSLCPERSLHIHLRNAGGCVDIALSWAYFVREGLESWAGGLWTGRVVVGESGRVSSKYPMSGAAALHRVLSQNFTDPFCCSSEGQRISGPSAGFPLYSRLTPSWEETC